MSTTANFSEKKEFHSREYDALKKEISDLVSHGRSLEVFAVGACAAFYAWYVSKGGRSEIVLFVPVVLCALGAFRSYAALLRIYVIAEYIIHLENTFALGTEDLQGWEHHLQKYRTKLSKGLTLKRAPLFSSAALFWLILIALTFSVYYEPSLIVG